MPRASQDAYLALRTLNLELARLPESVSSPTTAALRLAFWRDALLRDTFADAPPREPISLLLHSALASLAARTGAPSIGASRAAGGIKFWLSRFVSARARGLDDRAYPTLAALEEHAEQTYAALMYATLAFVPVRDVALDHVASHVGKACGIVAALRGVPVLAAPPRDVRTPRGGVERGTGTQALLLPLDVMAEADVREEEVFRSGGEAHGLQDAVFKVATRAHDHLITARELLQSAKEGSEPGHAFEHEGEAGHVYEAGAVEGAEDGRDTRANVKRGFGVLLEAVPALEFLKGLESREFDPFKPARHNWLLPVRIWQALRRQQI